MKSKIGSTLMRAFTLGSLFFYPLTASIQESAYFLHWTPTNSIELLICMAIMTGFFYLLLWLNDSRFKSRVTFAVLFTFVGITLSFFGIHFARQIMDFKIVERIGTNPIFLSFVAIAFTAAFYFFIIKKDPKQRLQFERILGGFLTVTFFVSLVSLWSVISALFPAKPMPLHSNNLPKSETPYKENVLILLFDEMSYQFLYKNKNINPLFPNFKQVSEQATNYHFAHSFGKETLTSIPPMLLGKAYFDLPLKAIDGKLSFQHADGWKHYDGKYPDIFERAHAQGLKTHVVGKYHPYCTIFKHLDSCDSCSTYNFSGVTKSFNVFHAFLTNFNILPSKMPFGLFKNPVASYNHKRTFEKELNRTFEIINEEGPFFAFIHFNSPHAPFVFTKNGFQLVRNPYNQNEENYMKQMEYLDLKLGEIIQQLKQTGKYDKTHLIIMSDHNYRKMTPVEEHKRIPLLVKKAGQTQRFDRDEKVVSGDIVNCLFPEDENCRITQ